MKNPPLKMTTPDRAKPAAAVFAALAFSALHTITLVAQEPDQGSNPGASSTASDAPPAIGRLREAILIQINEANEILVNGHPVGLADVGDTIDRLNDHNDDQAAVVMQPHPTADYERVMQVHDAAVDVGASVIVRRPQPQSGS